MRIHLVNMVGNNIRERIRKDISNTFICKNLTKLCELEKDDNLSILTSQEWEDLLIHLSQAYRHHHFYQGAVWLIEMIMKYNKCIYLNRVLMRAISQGGDEVYELVTLIMSKESYISRDYHHSGDMISVHMSMILSTACRCRNNTYIKYLRYIYSDQPPPFNMPSTPNDIKCRFCKKNLYEHDLF